jgi:serine/threonine protein kinase
MSSGSDTRAGVALIVGVGKYRSDRLQQLPFASRDARAMDRLLVDSDVCGFPRDRVALLTDRDAQRDKILEHLSKWLPERSHGAKMAVIYFACHGTQQKIGHDEEGYLLPYDVDPDNVVINGVAMGEVAHLIDAVPANAVIVILDCCHAGHVLSREGPISRSPIRDMTIKPTVFEKLVGKNRFLIASCDEGQKSIEAVELKHGLFTYHLLRGIRGTADRDRDGMVGVAELFNYVSGAVARDARDKFKSEQNPWVKGTWTDEIFLSSPKRSPKVKNGRVRPLDPLWERLGPDGAMAELERHLLERDERWLRSVLGFLKTRRDPVAIPFLIRCLAHRSDAIRRRAKILVQGFGWERVAAAGADLARKAHSERGALRVDFLLDGLAAIEANPDVVGLLERLVNLLKSGKLRDKATSLLDHKRLSVDLERVRTLFRETQSRSRIEKVLGPGMFTAAYLATHVMSGKTAVVRVLRPQFVSDDTVRSRFYDTSDRSFRSVHHNLVHTRDFEAIPERQIYYTVRDYIEGVTLQDVLTKGKKFDPLQTLEILRQTLDALTPVHRDGAFHGGVKPSNVFLCGDDRVHVILGDLGLGVAYLLLDRLSYDYRYAAPEMFQGGDGLSPLSDLYSLGCVGYELLCGSPPFTSDKASELMVLHLREKPPVASQRGSLIGPPGDEFFARLLAKTPSLRFRNIDETLGAFVVLRRAVLATQEASSAPIAILGQDSLSGYDPLRSIVTLGRRRRAPPPSGLEASNRTETNRAEDDEQAGHQGPARESSSDMAYDWDSLSPPVLQAGHVVFDKYRLVDKIGEGGMGEVWRVWHVSLEAERALKLIKSELAHNEKGWRRFQREARVMAKINHPNAVAVYDFRRTQSVAYIEMEFIRGRSLADVLKDGHGQPMPVDWTSQVLDQLCAVLQEAHGHLDETNGEPRPIIHRDLKPSNLMLVERKGDTGPPRLKVLDFGIAKIVDDESSPDLTGAGDLVGTPVYMSPEQIRWGFERDGGTHEIDGRSDIYSTGVVLYHLLTGALPFHGGRMALLSAHLHDVPLPMTEANPKAVVPPEIERVVRWCLEKDPARRPQTAQELARSFRAAVEKAVRPERWSVRDSRFWVWFSALFRQDPASG